MRHILYIPA